MTEPVAFGKFLEDIARKEVQKQVANITDAIAAGDWDAFRINRQTPEEVKQDAKERGIRTLWIQLLIDLLVAVLTVLTPAIADLDVTSKEQWILLGALLAKTVMSALVSYFFRLFFAPAEPRQVTLSQARRNI